MNTHLASRTVRQRPIIGETYTGANPPQTALLAGIGASVASTTLFLVVGALALPSAAFA